jgi:hypothetical protein
MQRDSLLRERAELLARLGPVPTYDYDHDGLRVWAKNPSFLKDPAFIRAYQKGMNSGHRIGRPAGSTADIHIEWRIHIVCAAAWHAKHLPGDFVECGVNTGIFSLALCQFLDFNSTGKAFYLFDTYNGIPAEQMSEWERPRRMLHNEMFEECYATACRNFAPYPKARLIRGKVPDTLPETPIDRVCYLSIDLNIAAPERAALEYFWDKLVPGAPVLLDDYGWTDHAEQKEAMDDFAARKGLMIFNLPTGQGLLLKPGS